MECFPLACKEDVRCIRVVVVGGDWAVDRTGGVGLDRTVCVMWLDGWFGERKRERAVSRDLAGR